MSNSPNGIRTDEAFLNSRTPEHTGDCFGNSELRRLRRARCVTPVITVESGAKDLMACHVTVWSFNRYFAPTNCQNARHSPWLKCLSLKGHRNVTSAEPASV